MSATALAPEIRFSRRSAEPILDPFAPSAIDSSYPCESCKSDGWVEWDDHTVGPCPACQGDPLA